MKTKKCSKCKEIKPKSEFYPDKRWRSGVCSACKKCFYLIYLRFKVSKKLKGKSLKEQRERGKKGTAKYRKKHPEKIVAREMARRYVEKKKNCEKCGSSIFMQMHHPDHSKPLDVVTLCRKCHYKEHWKYK
ncbi:MAG: hypothetical protein AABY22_22455 [Nanoarchaeota archaeon]